jgi:hypothetical protein
MNTVYTQATLSGNVSSNFTMAGDSWRHDHTHTNRFPYTSSTSAVSFVVARCRLRIQMGRKCPVLGCKRYEWNHGKRVKMRPLPLNGRFTLELDPDVNITIHNGLCPIHWDAHVEELMRRVDGDGRAPPTRTASAVVPSSTPLPAGCGTCCSSKGGGGDRRGLRVYRPTASSAAQCHPFVQSDPTLHRLGSCSLSRHFILLLLFLLGPSLSCLVSPSLFLLTALHHHLALLITVVGSHQ